MYFIGYEYKSFLGKSIKNLIVCKTEEEYFRVRSKVLEKKKDGVEVIFFNEVIDSKVVK